MLLLVNTVSEQVNVCVRSKVSNSNLVAVFHYFIEHKNRGIRPDAEKFILYYGD
jgi:hypothetical protein